MKPASARGSNGKFAEDQPRLAGVDVFRLQLRQRRRVEMRAVRAGHRGVFDDRHRGVGLAEHLVGQRAGLQQLGHVDRAGGFGASTGGGARRALRGSAGVAGVGRRLGLRPLRRNRCRRRAAPPAETASSEKNGSAGQRTKHANHLTMDWILQCRKHQKARVGAN